MEKSPFRIPDGVRPVMISKANFELLLREGRSFEEYFRFEEDDKYDAVEESVLEPEEENSSEEDDEAVTSDESEEMPPSEEDDEAATSEESEAEE